MTDTTKYNGWTNYATWRIWVEQYANDEAGAAALREMVEHSHGDACDLADRLQDHMAEWLEESVGDASAYVVGYAGAFLSQVNWDELARTALKDEGPNS